MIKKIAALIPVGRGGGYHYLQFTSIYYVKYPFFFYQKYVKHAKKQ